MLGIRRILGLPHLAPTAYACETNIWAGQIHKPEWAAHAALPRFPPSLAPLLDLTPARHQLST